MKHVAFLGPAGTYTEIALKQFIKFEAATPCKSIADVFRMVYERKCDAGFVPLENSVGGPISETAELLNKYKGQIRIHESHLMGISHALGVLPKAGSFGHIPDATEITDIYSHDQAFAQCSNYLRTHLPKAQPHHTNSSAAAIAMVREKELYTAGVIAARGSLTQGGFRIIAEGISDEKSNETRFALIVGVMEGE